MRIATNESVTKLDNLKSKYVCLFNAIVDTHFQFRILTESSILLEKQVKQFGQFILQTEVVISRLVTERQTINLILHKASNEKGMTSTKKQYLHD